MERITWGETIEIIGTESFKGCSSLETLTITNGITTIKEGGFSECTSLTSIVLPTSLETLGDEVFKGDILLKSITVKRLESPITCGNDIFKDVET